MPYEVIDHTADTGIRLWAVSPEELFREAARAMFELITDTGSLQGRQTKNIETQGIDLTDLLINWLRELLSLWNIDQCILLSSSIKNMTETGLSAKICLDRFDPEKHPVYADIKAVTYHNAQVLQTGDRSWQASVIFDV